ncbi:tail assembly chaperone [Metasolibacillus meyeri]|uniref:tail assembly chaperone n=1 Tax=Metasolibacillus meyeri TaxID=1071052 RepID=UPI000D308EE4|nr:tail assembly chaperone [Metasolibacillus meyeri]
MAILSIKEKEFELKFSVALDRKLNKDIKGENDNKNKLTGGLSKVMNDLLEMDIEALAKVFKAAMDIAPKEEKVVASIEEIMDAIELRMDEDGDATMIFSEVFAAIDASAFTRNELKKFVKNMKLVRFMRSKEVDKHTAVAMLQRMNESYKEITGKELFEVEVLTMPEADVIPLTVVKNEE